MKALFLISNNFFIESKQKPTETMVGFLFLKKSLVFIQ